MGTNLHQQVYTTVMRHLIEKRRAPHYTELAALIGTPIEQARILLRETAAAAPAATCWLGHDTDYVEAWGPFSNVPTHVQISLDDEHGWYGL